MFAFLPAVFAAKPPHDEQLAKLEARLAALAQQFEALEGLVLRCEQVLGGQRAQTELANQQAHQLGLVNQYALTQAEQNYFCNCVPSRTQAFETERECASERTGLGGLLGG
jgi:hypothetical protein